MFELKGIILMAIIMYALGGSFSRFNKYRQQGVCIIVDRKTEQEHKLYKGECLK